MGSSTPERRRRYEISRVLAAANGETRVHILELLAAQAWQTPEEMRAQVGVSQATMSRTLAPMVTAGLLERRGSRQEGGFTYAITLGGALLLEIVRGVLDPGDQGQHFRSRPTSGLYAIPLRRHHADVPLAIAVEGHP